jgi:hypothetical protein
MAAQALQAIQEAVDIFRVQGIIPYLVVGLRNVLIFHLELAKRTDELDAPACWRCARRGRHSAGRWGIRKAWLSSAGCGSSYRADDTRANLRTANCRFADLLIC